MYYAVTYKLQHPNVSHSDTRYVQNRFACCCCFHSFFWEDAAALLPKRKREVRLSAPVFLETYEEPANAICGVACQQVVQARLVMLKQGPPSKVQRPR
jgi:hypothetical protein